MERNLKKDLLEGLYYRLGRAVNRDDLYRVFLVNELTNVLCHGPSVA